MWCVYGIRPCFWIRHEILGFEKNVKIETIDLKLWKIELKPTPKNQWRLFKPRLECGQKKEVQYNFSFHTSQTKLKTLIWYYGPWCYLNITNDAQVWFKRLVSTTSFNIFKCKNFAIAYLLGSDVHQNQGLCLYQHLALLSKPIQFHFNFLLSH